MNVARKPEALEPHPLSQLFPTWPAAEFAEVGVSFHVHGQRNATARRKHVRQPKLLKVFEYLRGTAEDDILRGERAGG
jgi:hypothetical protein